MDAPFHLGPVRRLAADLLKPKHAHQRDLPRAPVLAQPLLGRGPLLLEKGQDAPSASRIVGKAFSGLRSAI